MTNKTLLAKLEAAQAIINTPEVARLDAEKVAAQKQLDRIAGIQQADPMSTAHDLERAAAKNRKGHAVSKLEQLGREIAQARKDASHLERMINSATTLATARQSWSDAADAQVQATKAATDAREDLDKLKAMLIDEQGKATAASLAQRTAVLAELGFAGKQAGTAAQAANLLAVAEVRIDALTATAIPEAEARVTRADDALVKCDAATRAAEKAIVQAHADAAEMNHAVALENYLVALHERHGALLAADGNDGVRVVLYGDSSRATFEQIAQRIQAAAEQGE